jgi:hypothetical protein
MTLEQKYEELLNKRSDVNRHFPLIRKSIETGDRVVELGVRNCVSTWALLANKPSFLISVDVELPSEAALQEVEEVAKEAGIEFKFFQGDSTHAIFPVIDVLFVDTLHLYSHVVKELFRHSEYVQKRIIFHDSKIPEVRSCIQDFLYNPNWIFEEECVEDTGLVVLKRVSRPA